MKMQKRIATGLVAVGLAFSLCACGVPTTSVLDGNGPGTALPPASSGSETSSNEPEVEQLKTLRLFSQKTVEILPENAYTTDTKIADVIADPVFGDYGRLIFPVDPSYYSGNTLGELGLTWYSHIDPNKTVEIANYMRSQYWNMVHGATPDQVKEDLEGMQCMRFLARNMAWFLRCKEAGEKAEVPLPVQEQETFTNFIR